MDSKAKSSASLTTIKRESWFICQDQVKPIIECPLCGAGLLGDTAPHGIHADGKVYNSVVCYKCKFHDYVQLEGWNGGEIPHK